MSVSRLENRTILITRPAGQGEQLANRIAAAGGHPLLLPAIEVVSPENPPTREYAAARLQQSDRILFISRNAVQFLQTLLAGDFTSVLSGCGIFAVGAATGSALSEAGIIPDGCAMGTGSESLLADPGLQPAAVNQSEITIVRGRGGREHLRETLQSYGARVEYLEVYQRRIPDFDPSLVKKIWHDIPPDAIVITSSEGLQNLVGMTAENDRTRLFNIPLAVISERLCRFARTAGFTGAIRTAAGPNDGDLLEAVMSTLEERE